MKLLDVSLNHGQQDPLDALWSDEPKLIVLANRDTRLVVAPHIGGSIAAYYENTGAGPVHWMRPATRAGLAEQDPLQMSSFPLLPYCNRIRDARFTFDGQMIDLAEDGTQFKHALHGHGWRRPWAVGHCTEHLVELYFEHKPGQQTGGDWPFHYRAQQRFELIGDALHLTLSAHNLSDRPMPIGMGHHPYYPRSAETTIFANVQAMWHADDEVLPTYLGPHAAVDAMRQGMPADAFDLDNNFTGWSRTATVAWPEQHRQLIMTAQAPFDHLVVFAPANQPLLCVEPVTNTTDCFNTNDTRKNIGGYVLKPGEEIVAAICWSPQRE